MEEVPERAAALSGIRGPLSKPIRRDVRSHRSIPSVGLHSPPDTWEHLMPEGYDSHADYMGWVKDASEARALEVRATLVRAFARFLEVREVEVINFSAMTALDLAAAIRAEPGILEPLMACCNVAGRAVERDLDIRGLDTYVPRLSEIQAAAVAGYLKPFLPQELAVPALSELDRFFYVDKEIRARKGRWEQTIVASLNAQSRYTFEGRARPRAGLLTFPRHARQDLHLRLPRHAVHGSLGRQRGP
jgi:hypothetical protein